MLNPVFESEIDKKMNEDVVTIITIHSAKGTEREVCYVLNVSPGSFPSTHSTGDLEKVEEERRVLYVALTRAKDELIITRHDNTLWSHKDSRNGDISDENPEIETYFFNSLPGVLVRDRVHAYNVIKDSYRRPKSRYKVAYGLFS